jgi:hypothetical protein
MLVTAGSLPPLFCFIDERMIHQRCSFEQRVKVHDLAHGFLIVFWEQRQELLHYGSGCHSIVC